MTSRGPVRRRIAYVSDAMIDVRMVEGLARQADVTLVQPTSVGDRFANFWPPGASAGAIERVALTGGRVRFVAAIALWLRSHRDDFDVVVVLDSLTAALGVNAGRVIGGPPVIVQASRPTLDYVRCQRGLMPAWRHAVRIALARALVAVNERRADAVAAVSDYVGAQAGRRCGLVRSIPAYGVDTDVFAPVWPKAEARRALGLPEAGHVVMWRSRLAPEKDPETFFEAIRLLRAAGREVHAVYMGGEFTEVTALARRHGVDVIARAPADRSEMVLWYVAADVDVQTSHAEGLGISPLEALSCGTPIVVSDVGGLPEVARAGRVGALVPIHDVASLATAIAERLDDPRAAARAAGSGRAWVVERYDHRRVFDDWATLVDEVAERFGRVTRDRRERRVLFVDHQASLSGGGERDMVDLAAALSGAPGTVHAVVPAEGSLAEALRAAGAVVHVVPIGADLRRVSRWELSRRPWLAARHAAAGLAGAVRLARLARSLDVDIVHTHSMKAHLLAIPAARFARAAHLWHVKDILEPGWLRRFVHRLAGAFATGVVCPSRAAAAQFEGTRVADRVRVVHPAVRIDAVSPGDRIRARRLLGAADGDRVVGMVGHTARWKGHDVFVDAAEIVLARRPDARFAMVASCTFPENEGAFHAALKDRVDTPGLGDRFVWLDGVENAAPLMAAFDVLVHASRLPEPFGMVLVEAMGQGTPVVASAIGAGPEIVSPDAGRIVEPGDPGTLADVIEAMLDDGAVLAAMGQAALASAARFDGAAAAAGMSLVYQELLAGRP
jgi:glycosyltransferase involved in cell wall biosynthesis